MSLDALFQPLQLGDMRARNRILMAPLTRNRSHPDGRPGPFAEEYYRQRASAGLIITEGTQISPMGKGYLDTPGLHSQAQVEGWAKVVDAVHAEGGLIAVQLWHVGRISHLSLLPEGRKPLAPSAIRAESRTFTAEGFVPTSEPDAMTLDDIAETIEDYRVAARNAKGAGFDGVELHAANGYLAHQFLAESANTRGDAYGGSVENRARFLLEATDALIGELGAGRVGVRIGPMSRHNDALATDPEATFGYVAEQLMARGVAFIHVAGTALSDMQDAFVKKIAAERRTTIIANGRFDAAKGAEWIANGWADAVAYGVPFLANPDLPKRFRTGAPLNPADQATFYGGGAAGYTDYPALAD